MSWAGGGFSASDAMVATLAPWLCPSTCTMPPFDANSGAISWISAVPSRSPFGTVRDSEILAAIGLASVADWSSQL